MLACTYSSQGVFTLLNKPKPVLQDSRDAIVRVTLASIWQASAQATFTSSTAACPGLPDRRRTGGVCPGTLRRPGPDPYSGYRL